MKIDSSLLVVICGEPLELVEPSLRSFDVFAEVIILDMIGDPKVEAVARLHNYTYEVIPRRPIVEEIRVKYVQKLSKNWVSFLDPDEVVRVDANEISKINEMITEGQTAFDVLRLKWIFHFKTKSLKGGYWKPTSKPFLINRNRVGISGVVHGGYTYDKSKEWCLSPSTAFLDHYWVYSLYSFLEKHFRYIKAERDKRAQNQSPQIGVRSLIKLFLKKLKTDYILNEGYKDGITGIFLALFHVFYVLAPEVLHRFSNSNSNSKSLN